MAFVERVIMKQPIFHSFDAACDWVDEHTSPETAGAFVIEQTAPDVWTVQPFRQPETDTPPA